nr:hypothetical protein [Pseudomonas amygdali]
MRAEVLLDERHISGSGERKHQEHASLLRVQAVYDDKPLSIII